jgi:hypothetical protein
MIGGIEANATPGTSASGDKSDPRPGPAPGSSDTIEGTGPFGRIAHPPRTPPPTTVPINRRRRRNYDTRLGGPFPHEKFASRLANWRDRLELDFSEWTPEGGAPTAELVERIKALRASVTVEATPERVTRRIRERRAEEPVAVEAMPVAQVIQLPVAVEVAEENPGTPRDAPQAAVERAPPLMCHEPQHTQREKRRRQVDGAQLRLF